MEQSQFGKINLLDIGKGLLYSVASAVIAYLINVVQAFLSSSGQILEIHWNILGLVALSTALGYLKVKFFTNSDGKPLTGEGK